MAEQNDEPDRDENPGESIAVEVGTRVVVPSHAGLHGVVVDDFGEQPSNVTTARLGDDTIAGPKRFAVVLDDGNLIFADDEDVRPA
jgi:hypothetical protein